MVRIVESPHGGFTDPDAATVAWCGESVCDGLEGDDLGPHVRWPELRCVRIDQPGAPVLYVPAVV